MQRRILGLIAIWCMLWLAGTAAASTAAEQAVGAVLDSLHRAASEADGALYFSLFADDAVFMGTDASERWTMDEFKAFAEPYFGQGKGWTYEVRERHIGFATGGSTAWFDEILWNESYGICRGTGVLVLADDSWKISQYNLTIPIPNDLARELATRIKEFDAGGEAAAATEALTVFLVRHAEKVDASRDPELSPAGEERAKQLAVMLRDAGIEHLHSSDYIRCRDTAAPLAARLGLDVELYDPDDQATIVGHLRSSGGRHLVVGHSNTIPEAVVLLGGDFGAPIDGHDEYDRLYVVTVAPDGTVSTVLMRFGEPYVGADTAR